MVSMHRTIRPCRQLISELLIKLIYVSLFSCKLSIDLKRVGAQALFAHPLPTGLVIVFKEICDDPNTKLARCHMQVKLLHMDMRDARWLPSEVYPAMYSSLMKCCFV